MRKYYITALIVHTIVYIGIVAWIVGDYQLTIVDRGLIVILYFFFGSGVCAMIQNNFKNKK